MKFFPSATWQQEGKSFAGHTLVVPAVSIGAVGQLALDLVVNTAVVNGRCCRAGYLRSSHMLDIAGEDPLGLNSEANKRPRRKRKKQDKESVSTIAAPSKDQQLKVFNGVAINLELLQLDDQKLTILQIRAPPLKGHAALFADELVDWVKSQKFQNVFLVSGADAMRRLDQDLQGDQLRYLQIKTPDVWESRLKALGARSLQEMTASPPAQDSLTAPLRELRGAGLTRFLVQKAEEKELPILSLLLYCREGNNISDSLLLANRLVFSLQIHLHDAEINEQLQRTSLRETAAGESEGAEDEYRAATSSMKLAIPKSWEKIFGRTYDRSLFE